MVVSALQYSDPGTLTLKTDATCARKRRGERGGDKIYISIKEYIYTYANDIKKIAMRNGNQ